MTAAPRKWLLAAGAALLLAFGTLAGTLATGDSYVTTSCQQIEALKTSIRSTLNRSLKLLGTKNGTAYAYYKAHPDDLKRTRDEIHRELSDFGPRSC